MKTIKHISLWVVVATCMVAVSTRGNAQAVSSTYFNVDWQFNAPVGNSYADKASGWGMNFEGGYYVMPKMAIGAFISYHTNNKYIDRQTLMLKSNSALTTDQQHSLSPEIGVSIFPNPSVRYGFHVALYYNYATNKSKVLTYDIDGRNNIGFRLGVSF